MHANYICFIFFYIRLIGISCSNSEKEEEVSDISGGYYYAWLE